MSKHIFVLFCLASLQIYGAEITRGYIWLGPGFTPYGHFSLAGSDFDVSGSFYAFNFGAAQCHPCPAGSNLDVRGSIFDNGFRNGPATMNGTFFPDVQWSTMNIEGLSMFSITGIGPGPQTGTGAGTYLAQFNFTGSLCGVTVHGRWSDPCAVDLPSLTGHGTVSIVMAAESWNSSFLGYKEATFIFESESVPEPSTLIPGAMALAIAFLAKRRRG